jgi:hypothetical protein
MGWLGEQKAKHPSLGLHKILMEHDDNLKTSLKWWKISVCAHFLKGFPYKQFVPL